MTNLDILCIALKKLLSNEAKNKLRPHLNTVKLCNLPFKCDKEPCLKKLVEYREVLRGRDQAKYGEELANVGKAIELVRGYAP